MAGRPSQLQIEMLVEMLGENPDIARGFLRTANGKANGKRIWDEIATKINAIGGAVKTGKAWAKYWTDKKGHLKRACALRAASHRQTGGGIDTLPDLSPIEERMLALLGEGFGEGAQHNVNPFPNSQDSTNGRTVLTPVPIELVESMPHTSQAYLPQPPSPQPVILAPERTPLNSNFGPQRSRRSQRSQLMIERDRLIRIEEKRVEAELKNAESMAALVKAVGAIAAAITRLADGLNK